ncbi:MAG TPA: MarR family winged helix-turn-helix transcriptional regulator [Rhodopila sp.]|uniref:MarR family winged helix-turn-helix transcriptional regulator n=1 Tax=Rhodopila sp. TaxID=2480087 RepID=UPI002C7C54BB|nr:MarR family winged helix-turn-helix transcriptional regulator [Rhodopila sp.]HVY15823.1 MarR family winged helix-turn-helix transcriptional regulator [Rhodopila sp.]
MADRYETAAPTAWDLSNRPGFLIRRLHQIHQAMFAEECAAFNVTPVQFSIMSVAAAQPGLDQARLGNEVGVDRTTLANVVARLEARALLVRTSGATDRRVKHVSLTPEGLDLLSRIEAPARRAHVRTIEALPDDEREAFLRALARLVEAGNEYGRAPLRLA